MNREPAEEVSLREEVEDVLAILSYRFQVVQEIPSDNPDGPDKVVLRPSPEMLGDRALGNLRLAVLIAQSLQIIVTRQDDSTGAQYSVEMGSWWTGEHKPIIRYNLIGLESAFSIYLSHIQTDLRAFLEWLDTLAPGTAF